MHFLPVSCRQLAIQLVEFLAYPSEASSPPELREEMRFISGIQTHPTLDNHNAWRAQSHVWGHQRVCESPPKRLRNLPEVTQEEERISAAFPAHLHPQKWVNNSVLVSVMSQMSCTRDLLQDYL